MTSSRLRIDGESLTIHDLVRSARGAGTVACSPEAIRRLAASRTAVESAVARAETIYGITTGFGKLANIRIDAGDLDRLQTNLIRSHAAGVGTPLPRDVVRAMMVLRANVLIRPTSGVRPALVEALLAFLNSGLIPWVPE